MLITLNRKQNRFQNTDLVINFKNYFNKIKTLIS